MLAVLRYLSVGLPVLLLFRLIQQKLWTVTPYSGLTCFLVIGLVRDLILLPLDYEGHQFSFVWKATLPVLLGGQIVAGLGTYRAIAKLYPGIGRFALKLFAGCLCLVCLGIIAFLPLEIKRIGADEAMLRLAFLLQQWVASLLAGGLMLAVLFLSRYPSPMKHLPRNIQLHTLCIALYFGSYAVLYALENTSKLGELAWVEMAHLAFVSLIYSGWAVGLSAAGQESEAWPQPETPSLPAETLTQAAGEG